jgi:hypothetical protein
LRTATAYSKLAIVSGLAKLPANPADEDIAATGIEGGKGDLIWLSADLRLAVVNDYKTLFGKQKQAPESGISARN